MDRPKLVALITGIFSIALAVLYLALVLILDHRSGLVPAPVIGAEHAGGRPVINERLREAGHGHLRMGGSDALPPCLPVPKRCY